MSPVPFIEQSEISPVPFSACIRERSGRRTPVLPRTSLRPLLQGPSDSTFQNRKSTLIHERDPGSRPGLNALLHDLVLTLRQHGSPDLGRKPTSPGHRVHHPPSHPCLQHALGHLTRGDPQLAAQAQHGPGCVPHTACSEGCGAHPLESRNTDHARDDPPARTSC